MKKVIISLDSGSTTDVNEFYTSTVSNLSDEDLTTIGLTVRELTENGDIWFKHYYIENNECKLVYVMDSESAVTNFAPALAIFESLSLYNSTNVQDLTFENFADYASEFEETSIINERVETLLNQQS